MRRAKRSVPSGTGEGHGLWPVLLLLMAAVLIPTACVLWFMSAAVRNERIAVRQKLVDAYRPDLQEAVSGLGEHWLTLARRLGESDAAERPGETFARLVAAGPWDSVVIRDAEGGRLYPPVEQPAAPLGYPRTGDWLEARQAETRGGDPGGVARLYAGIAARSADPHVQALALLSQARCENLAGNREGAITALTELATDPACANATEPGGRVIGPNALLMALQLMGTPEHPQYQATLAALAQGLNDYSEPVMPSVQRRFLMQRLKELAPDGPALLTADAEELAAEFLAGPARPAEPGRLSPTSLENVWQLQSADDRIAGLMTGATLADQICQAVARRMATHGVRTSVLAPWQERPQPTPFLEQPLGGNLTGWTVALHLDDPDFSAAADRQVAAYLWTGFLVILLTAGAVVLLGRRLLRQVRLTRLRNDFIATVSHELKTPLSGMRVLVDTLLDGRYQDQSQVREYLQLISKENERLSRLIDNFLSFSRMERNRRAFELTEVAPQKLLTAAADVVRDRFEAQGCRLEVRAPDDLPPVMADRDAMVTVLLNLLDNAFKYSENDRHIVLSVAGGDGTVRFRVQDNGVGLSRRAVRKIFEPFHQVDQSLSRRAEGCGLGLSIVKFIVDAHGGSIDVDSRPGQGSTFTVTLPAAGSAEARSTQ